MTQYEKCLSLPISGTTLPARRGVSLGYSTPGPKRQFVVTNTLTVGLSETFAVAVGGLDVLAAGEEVAEAISGAAVSEGVPVGVSVISSVFVVVGVSVGVCDGVNVGGGSLVEVKVALIWNGVLVDVPFRANFLGG